MGILEKVSKYTMAYVQDIITCVDNDLDRDKDELITAVGKTGVKTFCDEVRKGSYENNYSFVTISNDETYLYAMHFLFELLGNSIIRREFDDIKKMLISTGGDNPYTGSYAIDPATGKKYLVFERFDTLDTVPVLAHESMHYLEDRYLIMKNFFHKEVLPMLIEMICAYELNNEVMDPNLYRKCLLERFRSFVDLLDEEETFRHLAPKEYHHASDFVVAHCYLVDTVYMYVSSFIYAYNLFLRYKDDKKTLINKVQELFNNSSDILPLFRYYGIDFAKDKTFLEPIKLLKSYRGK